MVEIRPFQASDLNALYGICLKTGDSGLDGTHLYENPRIIGDIYAAPYALLRPDLVLVAQDEAGVAGYVMGVDDTRVFETLCLTDWWPRMQATYPYPKGTPRTDWTADQMRAAQIHYPQTSPQAVVIDHPAHLHINLLPRLQGSGMGRALVGTWLAAVAKMGGRGVHLGCNANNHRALRFYDAYGWRRLEIQDAGRTVWMGIQAR